MSSTRFHHGRILPVWLGTALAVCLLLPTTVVAAEPVGRVLVAAGGVTAEQEDASTRALGRRDAVYEGDRIRTGPRGRVQIRFDDGGLVDLERNSRFEIERYRTEEDGGGSAVMSFLRGAMRTITGAIGGGDGDDYRMQTSVATIGVRGTAYSLRYCDRRCQASGGRQGLYGRVDEGTVTTGGGDTLFRAGEYFFIPDGGAPRRIIAPPDGIFEGGDDAAARGDAGDIEDVRLRGLDGAPDDGGEAGDGDTDLLDPDFEAGDETDLGDLRPGSSIDAAFGGAFLGSSGFAVFESPGDGDVRIDDEGRIVGAEFEGFGFFDATGLDFNRRDTTTVTDPDTEEALFDVRWGSWSADSPVADGEPIGFLYAFTDPDRFTRPDEFGGLGSVSYGNPDGPVALANDGTRWQVDGFGLAVDFAAGSIESAGLQLEQVDSEASISIVGGVEGSLTTIDEDGSFSASGLSPFEGNDYSGSLSGRFLGTNADGALVAFEVREVDGEQRIVGAQVLNRVLD